MKRRAWLMAGVIFACLFFSVCSAQCGVITDRLLEARFNANEAAAKGSLKTIMAACESYRAFKNEYPESLQVLANSSPPYIDSVLGSGEKMGYKFEYKRGENKNTFTCTASPVKKGATGMKSFIIDQSGTISALGEDKAE